MTHNIVYHASQLLIMRLKKKVVRNEATVDSLKV